MGSDSNGQQPAVIDLATDQWQDYFRACLKAKIKHFEHLLQCISP